MAPESLPGYRIEGHAIVSADDRIATPEGETPASLSNEADWLRFQAALDEAAVVILGRLSHEANPNTSRRNRLIISTGAKGVERRDDGWWWNPAEAPLAIALNSAAPRGGTAAVPGGRYIFDLFLKVGFHAFHLARANRVHIPGGIPIFSAIEEGRSVEDVLAEAGLAAAPEETLDEAAHVTLVTWRRTA
jgi:hypothetical protein